MRTSLILIAIAGCTFMLPLTGLAQKRPVSKKNNTVPVKKKITEQEAKQAHERQMAQAGIQGRSSYKRRDFETPVAVIPEDKQVQTAVLASGKTIPENRPTPVVIAAKLPAKEPRFIETIVLERSGW